MKGGLSLGKHGEAWRRDGSSENVAGPSGLGGGRDGGKSGDRRGWRWMSPAMWESVGKEGGEGVCPLIHRMDIQFKGNISSIFRRSGFIGEDIP